ncbi:MAG: sulfatase [Bacteroides sp.]|nr:sulfatase [Bacteroides sp.]
MKLLARIVLYLLIPVLLPIADLQARAKKETSPPNIIVIICDDLNDAIHGMGGHPQALTPNLDALATRGVRFTNAQCNAPLCGPSRASLWSGLYPHTTGYFGYNQQPNHWRNNPVLSKTVTLFEHFSRNGYQVYASGKIHHNGHEDKSIFINADGSSGFQVEASFGPYPWDGDPATATLQQRGVMPPDFPEELQASRWSEGFGPVRNISASFEGKGSWLYDHWGKEFHIESEEERDRMPDEACTDYAVSLLESSQERPFLMVLGYNRPHSPQYVPESYFDLYGLDTLILSPWLANDLGDCAQEAISSKDIVGVNVGSHKYKRYFEAGGETLIKKWTQAYLASVSFVDDQVGQVMEALDASSFSENTLLIFTSDHGYHMGEKKLIFKNTAWEESTRVPMVIAGPGVTMGEECHSPVSLVDLYPTLTAYCSLPPSPNIEGNRKELDGFSMIPLFEKPVLGEWEGPDVALTAVCSQQKLEINQSGPVDQQHYSARSERYRYILYRTGEEELYDHRYDPYEWFNLSGDPGYVEVKKDMNSKLVSLVGIR